MRSWSSCGRLPLIRPDSPTRPIVYMTIIGLVLWLILWVLSVAGDRYSDYLLVVVSGFIFIAVAIPSVLSRVMRKSRGPDAPRDEGERFRDWAAGEFDTWQDR